MHGYIDHWLFGKGLQVLCFPHDKPSPGAFFPHDYDMFIKREDGSFHTTSPHDPHREDYLDPKLARMRRVPHAAFSRVPPPAGEWCDEHQP